MIFYLEGEGRERQRQSIKERKIAVSFSCENDPFFESVYQMEQEKWSFVIETEVHLVDTSSEHRVCRHIFFLCYCFLPSNPVPVFCLIPSNL